MAKGYKKGTLFGKKQSDVIKEPGSETARAERAGRSVHEQAEVDSKSPDKKIRGKGQFALNASHFKKRGHKPPKSTRVVKKTARKLDLKK